MEITRSQADWYIQLGIDNVIDQYIKAREWGKFGPFKSEFKRLCEFLKALVQYFPEEDRDFFATCVRENGGKQ